MKWQNLNILLPLEVVLLAVDLLKHRIMLCVVLMRLCLLMFMFQAVLHVQKLFFME